jgi:hypothetical protein
VAREGVKGIAVGRSISYLMSLYLAQVHSADMNWGVLLVGPRTSSLKPE